MMEELLDELPEREDDEMLGRHFANAIMHWKVTNISLALCSPSILVHSPEFSLSGPVQTNWRMSLDISAKHDRILLYLEMLGCKVRNTRVKVNWMAYVLDPRGERNVAVAVERCHTFTPYCRLTVDAFELWSVIKTLPDAAPDALRIRCSMLVQFGYNPPFPKPTLQGVISLCHDLSQLPKESLFPDVIIEADKKFPLHRAMLCHRSRMLRSMIQPHLLDQTIRLQLQDKDALEAIFFYLYSGDLSYIMSNPSVTICDYIERLGIPELKDVYPLEKLKLESIIDAKEHVFGWTIVDFRNIRQPISGVELHEEGMRSRWKLHMYPMGPPHGGPGRQNKFLYVEAELLESVELPMNVCLEFSSVNDRGEILHSRRIHGPMNARDRIGLEYFKVGGTNMEKCLVDDALFLRFTVRIATGETTALLREHHPVNQMPLNNDRTYTIFSQMMGNLLVSRDYADVMLLVDGDYFKAHRFVLASRSPTFKRLLAGTARDRLGATLTIPNVNKHAFRVFLEYLYTGKLNDIDVKVVMQVYDICVPFNVSPLWKLCVELLVTYVDQSNVIKFLLWSHDRCESSLKTHILNVLAPMWRDIMSHPDWKLLSTSRPDLCSDVLSFLRKNLRKYPYRPEGDAPKPFPFTKREYLL